MFFKMAFLLLDLAKATESSGGALSWKARSCPSGKSQKCQPEIYTPCFSFLDFMLCEKALVVMLLIIQLSRSLPSSRRVCYCCCCCLCRSTPYTSSSKACALFQSTPALLIYSHVVENILFCFIDVLFATITVLVISYISHRRKIIMTCM